MILNPCHFVGECNNEDARCPILSVWIGIFVVLSAVGVLADERGLPISLVPQPMRLERMVGSFLLKADTRIRFERNSLEAANIAEQLAERLRRSDGLTLQLSPSDEKDAVHNAIVLMTSAGDATLGDEGYTLKVSADGVVITATRGAGLFYGSQTLLQLLPPQVFSPVPVKNRMPWTVPAVNIADQPRFRWRGLLLDVARHFFNKEEIKNYLDLMAQHKLNTLQLHLTDDQGWRIEIKRYPKLTEIGAWRKDIGFGLNPMDGTAYDSAGRYGGFYTQDDLRELVAYAKARYVTIVPEIEMPGHAGAALSVYPEVSCFGGPYDRDSGPMGICCPGNEATFTFFRNILTEVAGLFPGKYIHIGADEVDKSNWTKCPKCQSRMKQEGLKNANDLQSYFVKRIGRFVNERGRTLIGWDEILEGGLAANGTVMSWRGVWGGVVAANAGHDVVMTPTSHCYFDYYQAQAGEPKAIGGFLPLRTVYAFEPVPPSLSAEKAKYIIGAGGTLWSEYFPNYAHVQYMTYPRACAMAEVTWSNPKPRPWDDFKSRLDLHLQRLEVQGVHYRKP